jgi:hypothetical protein
MIFWKLGARFSTKPDVPFLMEEIPKTAAAISRENFKSVKKKPISLFWKSEASVP